MSKKPRPSRSKLGQRRDEESAFDLGSALKALSATRQQLEEEEQELDDDERPSNAEEEVSLQKELAKSIERQNKKKKLRKKLRQRAALREAIILKAKMAENEKLLRSHKTIAEESNTRVLAR